MRKGFDGLSGLVREGLMKDPLSRDVFISFNPNFAVAKSACG
jgi:hypothetical protein